MMPTLPGCTSHGADCKIAFKLVHSGGIWASQACSLGWYFRINERYKCIGGVVECIVHHKTLNGLAVRTEKTTTMRAKKDENQQT